MEGQTLTDHYTKPTSRTDMLTICQTRRQYRSHGFHSVIVNDLFNSVHHGRLTQTKVRTHAVYNLNIAKVRWKVTELRINLETTEKGTLKIT